MKNDNDDVQQHYDQVKKELIAFISKEFAKEKEMDISPDFPLLERGVIDSLSIMTLIVHIENQYSLDFYKIDVTRDRFSSVNSISQMVMENISPAMRQ